MTTDATPSFTEQLHAHTSRLTDPAARRYLAGWINEQRKEIAHCRGNNYQWSEGFSIGFTLGGAMMAAHFAGTVPVQLSLLEAAPC